MAKNLLTPPGLLLTSSLFKARLSKDAKPGDKAKFFIRIGFTAEDMKTDEFKAIGAAITEAARGMWGAKADAMIKEGSVAMPFRKDIAAKQYPEHLAFFIQSNANEEYPPSVVDANVQKILDHREIYPGCKVRMSLSVRAYGGPGTAYKAGIAVDMRNVQKLADGPKLANASADASDDFGAPTAATGDDDLSKFVG